MIPNPAIDKKAKPNKKDPRKNEGQEKKSHSLSVWSLWGVLLQRVAATPRETTSRNTDEGNSINEDALKAHAIPEAKKTPPEKHIEKG